MAACAQLCEFERKNSSYTSSLNLKHSLINVWFDLLFSYDTELRGPHVQVWGQARCFARVLVLLPLYSIT